MFPSSDQDQFQYLVSPKDMVVNAPKVLDRLEALHHLDAALVRLAGIPALLLRPLPVVPEAVPILLANMNTNTTKRGDKVNSSWGGLQYHTPAQHTGALYRAPALLGR